MEIRYQTSRQHHHPIDADAFVDLLRRSTLGERRPLDDRETMAAMVEHADLLATAWDPAGKLVGVARSVTDFSYCCYLSELAVDTAVQRAGIGRGLIVATLAALGPRASLILLAAPAAVDYYPRIGFNHHPQAWILRPGDPFPV
jgi:GNAT superfamily N-acetyltransferase